MSRWRRRTVLIPAMTVLACMGGCEKTARNMYDQPRDKPLAQSALWSDTRSAREPVAGAEAYSAGTLAGTSSGRLGTIHAEPPPAPPLPTVAMPAASPAQIAASEHAQRQTWTLAVLARGRERFDIFCAPCHSIAGDGDGMIARRGFPHPPSFHVDRLRNAPDAHFYAVITDGYGAMFPYATRIPPDDRHAIVAYIRALQLSQHAGIADLPPQVRDKLGGAR